MVQCEACFSHQGELITAFALFDNLYLLQDAQNANDFIFVMLNIIAMHFAEKGAIRFILLRKSPM